MAATANQMTLARALEMVRNNESEDIHQSVNTTLQKAIDDIWRRIHAAPDTYIMTKQEFAVFNYFRPRFADSEVTRRAVERFWNHFKGDASVVNGC